MGNVWLLISILIVLVLLLVGFLLMKKMSKKKRPTDYYNLFIIGIIWFLIGFPLNNGVLGFMGLVFMLIGLLNKEKWKKNRLTWDKMTEQEKMMKMIIIGVLFLLVILSFVVFILFKKGMV